MIKLAQNQSYSAEGEDFQGKISKWPQGGWVININLSGGGADGSLYGVETEDDIDRIASAAKMVLRAVDSKKAAE